MESIDAIRSVFKRISELQKELESVDPEMVQKIKKQVSEISALEDYNFRKAMSKQDFEPIDTLTMRKEVIIYWEIVLNKKRSIETIK